MMFFRIKEVKEVVKDLYEMNDIKVQKDYYSKDNLTLKTSRKLDYVSNDKIKHRILASKLSFIKNWNNILLAGGSLCNVIESVPSNQFMPKCDIDLFLNGLIEEQAYEKIKEIYNDYEISTKFYNNITITKNAITFDDVQIILKLYATKKDILDSFDLEASCIGFDGNTVFLNERAKFAYETGYNTVDMKRYSPTYCHRLNKYHRKGFGIILIGFKKGDIKNKQIKLEKYTLKINSQDDKYIVGWMHNYNYNYTNNSFYQNWEWINNIQYYNHIIQCFSNNKTFPIRVKEITKTMKVDEEIVSFFKNKLYQLTASNVIDKRKIKKNFTKTPTIEVLTAIINENKKQVKEYIAKETKFLEEIVNKEYTLEWDNYLEGLRLEEIYKYPMTYTIFYGL